MMETVRDFMYVGKSNLVVPEVLSPYDIPPNNNQTMMNDDQKLVRNLPAYQLLHSFFLISNNDEYKGKILEIISLIFTSHSSNFHLLQSFHTLPLYIEHFDTLSPSLKVCSSFSSFLSFQSCLININQTKRKG